MTTVTANTPANALNSMDIHNASDVCILPKSSSFSPVDP